MHKKLNAVMQMDPPGSRRRIARNPITDQHQQQDSLSPIPADADSSNDAAPSGGGAAGECRRSSRKKTIKFDVRDLLNKTRKNHKIQIEARIDSNAPSNKASGTGAASSRAELDSKQKNFIEKSAIFRRYSISENKLPPRPPPPPGALMHTIQQCVGELEQLPLAESGELNLAAISPIARRLSRTQDILTASMIKPKQVSSLIVTKLESASTAKAATSSTVVETKSMPTRRRVTERCEPSTSNAATAKNKQQKVVQRRGRKPKAKVFDEPTTKADLFSICNSSSPSSSIDGSFLRYATQIPAAENGNEPIETGNSSDPSDTSTTGIDLKENLDASAVTLPLPTIPADDCARNSTDESIAATEEDTFSIQNLSSDESIASSSKEMKANDEISLFGRSNSTDTTSSDSSEKRQRKIRIAVKRVSLTPQFLQSPSMSPHYPQSPQYPEHPQSPLGSSSEEPPPPENGDTVDLLSSTNNDVSNDRATAETSSSSISALKQLNENENKMPLAVPSCTTPPVAIDGDTTSVDSSVVEIVVVTTKIANSSVPKRRGRSKANKEQPAMDTLNTQEEFPFNSNNRSSSARRQIHQQPTETITASIIPTKSREDVAQPLAKEVASSTASDDTSLIENPKPITPKSPSEETSPVKDDSGDSNSIANPKTRSLRSTQSNLESLPQLTLPTRQRKSNKVSSPVIEDPPAAENNAKTDVSPVLINSSQIEIESAQESIAEVKITRSRALKKKFNQGDPVLTDKNQTNPAKDGLSTSADKKETNISKPEGESTTDRSSADETASSDRRESPRLRSSASLAMTKLTPNKVFTAVSSSTPDSESSAESTDGRDKSSKTKTLKKSKPITNSEKVSEENSGMCSESSSITSSSTSTSSGSSTSSSSAISASDASSKSGTSSSTSSSSSGSSSSASSTFSEGRSTPSSKEEARKSPLKSAVLDRVKSSARSDSECSEKSSTSDDMRFKKLEKISQRRKTARLERLNRWSSEGSESSCSTVSRTRSGRSRGRLEDTNSQKNETSVVNETNESVPETPVENSAHATSQLRSKSKKRTRRFVPIKYSSSESGSLSDDGRKPPPAINVPSRMTRTRRKTISSASDFDELPSNNLSPPDLALEYLPRRSKLGMAKSQGDLSKIGTDDEAIKLDTKTRRSRSKKGIRNSSRCRSQSTAALKSDLTFKDTKGVQEINDYSQTASPTLSVSSYSSSSAEETQTKDLPQRKITRLSLKNQNSDSGNSESQTKKKNSDSNNDHVCQVMPTLVPDCLETIKDDGKDLEGKSKAGQIIVEPENSSSQIKNSESEASNSVKSSPKHKKTTKSIREKSGADAIDEASGICNEKDVELSVQSDPLKENVKDPPSDFRRITRFSPKNLEVATAEPKSNEQLVEKEEPEAIKKVTRSSLKRIEIIANSSPDAIKEKTSEPEDKDFVSIPDLSKEQVKISPKARKVGTNSPKSTEEQQKQVDEELQDLEITSPDLRSNATSCSTTNQQEEEPKQLDKVHSDDIENTLQEEPKQIPLESELVAGEQKVSSPKTKQSTPKQQEKEFKHVDSLQSDEKAIVAEQKTLTSLESAIQEPVSVESPKGKRQPTRAAAALKSPTKPKTEDKKEEPNAIDKTSDDLNSVPTIQTQENDQIIKVPRELRKTTRFSPRVPENSQTPQDESMVEKFSVENETEKKDIQLLSGSAELSEQEKTTKGAETNETLPTAVVEVSSDNRQIEKTLKDTNDDCQVREPGSSIEVQAVKTTRARKATRFSPLVSPTSIHEIKTKSTEIEVPQKVSEDQVFSTTEIPNSSLLPPVLKPQDSNRTADDVFPKIDAIEMPPSASNSTPPSKKSDYASKKVIKQQLQSMLDSLTLVGSNTTPPKETTPRRKKKTLTPVAAPPSSDSNQSDEPMKQTQQEPTQKIDQKPATPRRKLDSSFIESLEKSLLRSAKKASKKKEKDKAAIAQILTPTITAKEENTKKSTSPTNSTAQKPIEQCEELKKPVEAPSPKLKKKQPKESPKQNKKLDDQNLAKRKNLEKTKKSEESSFANIFKDVAVTSHPQPPKTKAETKFFSPGKSSIEYEPSSPPQLQPPVVQDVSPQLPVEVIKEKSPDLIPDPLKDIEKFIEDGVNLLKRTYKIDADDDTSLDRDILKPDDIMTPKKCKLDENVVETALTPTANSQGTSPRDDDNSNSNSECSNLTSLTNTSTSEIDTPNGIRRSHRIKNNSKSTKCLVGRGLVRERERFSTKDDEKTIYSIDDQKMDLAEVEAKNSKFLKDMEERLSNFRVIRENEYKCERVISKEAKRMLCDCFLTAEEEERGELGCGEDCLNRLLMIECGTDCTVRERCTNRRFNKFLYSPCRVFRTEKKGFGIMADIEILPGEFIMEYVGEVINGDEFEIRINEYSKDKNKHYYFMALRSDAVIDATAKGNISRFINHSCDPNAETQKWTVNGELRIGFFSRKSIMPGEEITFDYQYQRYGKEAQRCYCESSNCRGWIGAEPSSEEEEEEEVDEEDESEETEEEEPSGAVAPVLPVVPSPIPLDVAITDAEKNLTAPTLVAGAEVSAIPAAGEVDKPPQPVLDPSVPSPTPTTPAPPTPTVPDMLKPSTLLPKKTKKEKKRLHEEKLKRREPKQFLEDPDIEDEVRFLVKCGLRNQADTLRLSRLIVRAKLLETRIKLLQILRKAELPCRRLFLDYHGLRLLHGWMSEVIDTRNSEENLEIRMELLSVLECLPIPNKTMLNDSKVYYTVRDWSNNKESHSPSDRSPKESNLNSSDSPAQPMSTEVASSELQKLAAKLVHTWNNLPEVFRIPKRERIEQMKEHEREADRHYNRDDRDSSDRNRNRERFVSKNGKKGRFQWSKEKERDRANDRRKFAQNSSNSGKDSADKLASTLAGGDSHLSKEQRRELFAAKVARDEAEKRLAEERREFDIKCRFFGLDPKRIRPENMPFCVNPSTGQWFSTDKKPIATPPSYAHVQVPVKPKSTNPEDYRLPPMDLPPLWKFAISPQGKIYYYHVKIRIPQWEPPIKILPLSGQNDANAMKNSESDSSNTAPNESSEDDIEVIKGLDPVKLQAYIEKRIENRRLQRYTRLVEEKPISPRKEEDRIYNQMEVRKYKENKEKIRKRKEEIRKRRDIIGLPSAATVATVESSTSTNAAETTAKDGAEPLPIQDYLLSSEEEELLKAECNNSPLIDKIVQGDKIVDELDALHRKRSMKRALPIRDKYDHKKRKLDKNKESSKSTKRSKDGDGSGSSSSSSKYRKVREKFRCEIAGIIVQHLKPYRGETCSNGRILTDDDFNHLARKLTHFVMVKELKYCESIGQTLIVTESVKNKSREFIKKYMAKYGKVYVRPKNDPEFKDIPFL